jgi:hypothetical protein
MSCWNEYNLNYLILTAFQNKDPACSSIVAPLVGWMQLSMVRGFRASVDQRPFMYAFLASISGVQMLVPLLVSLGVLTPKPVTHMIDEDWKRCCASCSDHNKLPFHRCLH